MHHSRHGGMHAACAKALQATAIERLRAVLTCAERRQWVCMPCYAMKTSDVDGRRTGLVVAAPVDSRLIDDALIPRRERRAVARHGPAAFRGPPEAPFCKEARRSQLTLAQPRTPAMRANACSRAARGAHGSVKAWGRGGVNLNGICAQRPTWFVNNAAKASRSGPKSDSF